MYRLKEKADKLSKFIELSKEKHTYRRPDLKALQADNDWAAAHFLAKLLFDGLVAPYTYISTEQLKECHREFEEIEGSLNLENLIKIFWIRIISDIVEIPNGVSSAAGQYEKIKEAEPEFNFLIAAVETLKSTEGIKKPDFIIFHSQYETENELTISLDKCKAMHFVEIKDETVKVYNLEYNKPIFQHKKELQFISFLLLEAKKGDKYKLLLDKKLLEATHTAHVAFFPKTPPLTDLILQKVFVVEEDIWYLNLWSCGPDYWTVLCNKIGDLLWVLMRNSGKYPVRNEMVRNWILKLRFIDNFIKSPEIMKTDEIDFLLTSCCEILLAEKDLIGPDQEINKLVLSNRRSQFVILANAPKIGFPDLTKAKNIFELFNLMEECNEVHQSDLLWMQESRWFIDDLVQTIIFFDIKTGEDGIKHPLIRQLLCEGSTRPYLLWKMCFFIYYWKPEIIPTLCLDVRIASLAFNLYLNSETDKAFPEHQASDLKKENLRNCFSLILSALKTDRVLSNSDKALTIFECLVLTSENKWHLFKADRTMQIITKRDSFQAQFEILIEVLRNKKLDGSFFSPEGKIYKYFFCDILSDLFTHVKEYNSQKVYTEGVVGLPLVKMELLSMLLTLLSSAEYKKQKDEVEELKEDTVVNQFLNDYTSVFNLVSIHRWSYQNAEMEQTIPLWSTNQKGAELIRWEEWVLYFEKYNLLPQFLLPTGLKLKPTSDKWDKYNQFAIDKIRTHIEILITAHQRLRLNEFNYKQQGHKIETAISRLEQAIVDFISKYSYQDSATGSIDIFEDRYERTVFGSEENALIPVIAQAVNKFEQRNKEEILKSLTKTDSFTKCLKLLEFLSSESDRDFIKKQIKDFDVAEYLDEKNYIPEIETVVIKLSEVEEFIDKAKEALNYWETRVLSQRDNTEYQITHFRLKLLIAYYEGNEKAILNEQAPPVDSFSTSKGYEFKPGETRDFYLGLVKLKNNDPENAYNIFKRLITSSKNDKAAIAINRFYSHIKLAETKTIKEEKIKSLSDALQEWDTFEKSIPDKKRAEALGFVQENIWLNKLSVFNKLERYTEFDNLFNSLDKTYQLRSDFFEKRVNNYVQRGHYELARSFVNEAKQYHQLKDNSLPEFIKTTVERLENEDDYRRLRKEYQDLILRSPEKLVLILPENVVGKRNVPNFILKEICNSANDILDIVNSIEEINNEDKYTDILILSLQSKFRNWYWKIGNTRGGFSASNKRNPGELDFIIRAADNERIATCEALLLHGKNTSTTTTHAVKTFNYDHRRQLFFILAYYNGDNFMDHWEDYKTTIIPNIKYPAGFPLYGDIEEIKETYTNNSIRALLAKNGNDTKVYHVFINLNYKLPIP
ncbi:MAG: hypothetical protein JST58_02905 [Bacteroidetes bacterium]|nr:hypothetical protein [Bacteroidota bacterium]